MYSRPPGRSTCLMSRTNARGAKMRSGIPKEGYFRNGTNGRIVPVIRKVECDDALDFRLNDPDIGDRNVRFVLQD